MPNEFAKLEKTIGYKFTNIHLLLNALTHRSYAAEVGSNEYNERMEFLGDSILSAAVADYLYQKYPSQDEGRLSHLKSQIVSRHTLNLWAKKIKLGTFILISKGEESSGGRLRESLLANALEALIAAIYLDSDFIAARKFIFNYLIQQRRLVVSDAKSKLQEYIQSAHRALPEYRVLAETGPDHEKVFEIAVYLKKTLLGSGTGRSKKEAEQVAARKALKAINEKKKQQA